MQASMSTVNGDRVRKENGASQLSIMKMRSCLCPTHNPLCLPTVSHSWLFGLFSSSKVDLDILLQIVGSASQCLKGTKACVQIVFPNCGVNNEILGLHKLVGKQWNLSKFGLRGKRMALSTQCLASTNGLLSSPPYLPHAATISCSAYHTSLLFEPFGIRQVVAWYVCDMWPPLS